jgi:hypothetical protein
VTKLQITATWDGRSFVPDHIFLEDCQAIGRGNQVGLTVEQNRSEGQHRWFFAMMKATCDAGYYEHGVDELLDDIKFGIGYGRYGLNRHGEKVWRPKSISFAKCDGIKFKRFVHFAERWLATELGVDTATVFAQADRETGEAVDRRAA